MKKIIFAMSSLCLLNLSYADLKLVVEGSGNNAYPVREQSIDLSAKEGDFEIYQDNNATVIRSDEPRWSLILEAPNKAPIQAMCYERGKSDPFNDVQPGLDFGYGSSGCGGASSRFKVHEIEYDPSGKKVTKLAVDFVQTCDISDPNIGRLRFNSDFSMDTKITPVFDSVMTFDFVSDERDYIGKGKTRALKLAAQRTLSDPMSQEYVRLIYDDDNLDFDLEFASIKGTSLKVGEYKAAQRAAFREDDKPGLVITGNGAGCNKVYGNFKIDKISFDTFDKNLVTEFDASFEQYCDRGQTAEEVQGKPKLKGRVTLNTEVFKVPYAPFKNSFEASEKPRTSPFVHECEN